jgi:uncharacterized membrane protein
MTTLNMNRSLHTSRASEVKRNRVESIDVLRGIVMITMAIDHVRDYFHYDAFLYDPTDLSHTNLLLFFTRFITHYCAPVFVFLAGMSAYLYGANKSRSELTYYLFTRGMWLVFAELFIVTLAWTFNPSFPVFNLQVIWAIGISMIVLSAMISLKRKYILVIALLLIVGHNLLDHIHVPGSGIASFLWSVLHDPKDFDVGQFSIFVRYPVMPWTGIIALGYYFGSLYNYSYNPEKRRRILSSAGFAAIALFLLLRSVNIYGDPAHWSLQKNQLFTVLSLLNVTKYPPSLLYILVTLGPPLVFLGRAEKPVNRITSRLAVFGRVPFFYYVLHLYLIHLLAVIGAALSGHNWSDMILSDRVNRVPGLKGYGFSLGTVYLVWVALILLLYPCCKWFDRFKRTHQANNRWLTYL